jgi:RNA-directed DNA polymerase
VIQQAIAPVIGPLFEPHCSTHGDGCRPGRRARMALAAMEAAHRDGLRDAVDGDLQRFFDTVHHRVPRNRLARRRNDRRVLRRISRYVRAGVIRPDGRREHTLGGVPQGGLLSPRRAKVRLDELDADRERRGLRFAR